MKLATQLIAFVTGMLALAPNLRAEDPHPNRQLRHATGFVQTQRSRDFLARAPRVSFARDTTPIPGSYSIRGQAGPVENQGQCGSCWDFSLTGVLRGTGIMAGKDPGRLSYNYLLNCDTTMDGCNGGDFSAADLFVNPKGAPAYGSDGQYTQTQGKCQNEAVIASTTSYTMLGTGGTDPSFHDVAYVVGVLHQPVSIDVAADANWENYTSGIYSACSDENVADINHMVSLEGYDCETSRDAQGNCVFDANGNLPAGVGKWIIRNSWGTDWGDQGYITTKATDSSGNRCNSVVTDALFYAL